MRRHVLVTTLGLLLVVPTTHAELWPVGDGTTPPAINTSFGPRIVDALWDFHDGIDFPAPIGTPVIAVADAEVFREGPGGTDGYSSRHVVLRWDHPTDGRLTAVYLHLDSLAPGLTEGMNVRAGQLLGTVGEDGTTYPHLHFEIRRGGGLEIDSVHPMHYMTYTDTANFAAPRLDRIGHSAGGRLVRFVFEAPNKDEGDLVRAEVELWADAELLETRVVDFDDKTTINEGRGDALAWRDDIAVEGYQRSDMVAAGRSDLHHGLLVRKLPPACTALVPRVVDVAGNAATGARVELAALTRLDRREGFEDGVVPPVGWTEVISTSGERTSVDIADDVARVGLRSLRALDASTSETSGQRAGVQVDLGGERPRWSADAWVRPEQLTLDDGDNVYPLHFVTDANGLAFAATLRGDAGAARAGLIVKDVGDVIRSTLAPVFIDVGSWRHWGLEGTRLGTREATAVLTLDGREVVRRRWDDREFPAAGFRTGIGTSSTGATATVVVDEVVLTDGDRFESTSFAPGRVEGDDAATALRLTKEDGDILRLSWGDSCSVVATDHAVYLGTLGSFADSTPLTCTTGGLSSLLVGTPTESVFFLAVPLTETREGSHGRDHAGVERPTPPSSCCPQFLAECD
ncbi:MAG: M23 family metallopeptidase [Acidobacteriota bacterium]